MLELVLVPVLCIIGGAVLGWIARGHVHDIADKAASVASDAAAKAASAVKDAADKAASA